MRDPLHDAKNFAQVFHHWAETTPEALAFRYLHPDDSSTDLTYGALDTSARRIASALLARANRGDRALLLYEPGLAFIEAFAACHYAGIVPVPMFPPDPRWLEETLPNFLAIAACADAAIALTSAQVGPMLQPLTQSNPAIANLPWLTTDTKLANAEQPLAFDAQPSDLALLQFTSGSTTTPRGVMVSHGNLLHNERAIRRAFGHDQFQCRGVGWLPTYHDMGLIGKVLQSTYLGIPTVLMSPFDFIQRPYKWLQAITEHRGTTCGGPNFAYELCARRITDEQLKTLDLSCWKVAFCGAEPVHHATLERFATRFAPAGFKREALFPCYGLAESTLMVTGGWLGRSAQPHWFRAEAIERNSIESATPDATGSQVHVSCGPPVIDQQVIIVDPEAHTVLGSDSIGEIWIKGPSVAAGYWREPRATEETFEAHLPDGNGPWLRTGDLGVLRDGQLIVTGRSKDLLILHGRNLYPQDIEATVRAAHRGIHAGSVAAVSLQADGQERLGLVVGIRQGEPQEIERAIRQAISVKHGLSVYRLALVRPDAIPRTSSGKLRRAECRQRLVSGDFGAVENADRSAELYPSAARTLEKLENRNTKYRFDLETDIHWDRVHESGVYFPASVLSQAGVDTSVLGRVPGLLETFQWALAVAICEEFVALEQRILSFLGDERTAGRLPTTRSADLFEDEEVKHVALFRRYADLLKSQRPQIAPALDRHLLRSFETAWWYRDSAADYPSVAVHHFVTWLHFVYFEEYSIYLCNELERYPEVQPAWLTAHIAHRQEERQHVLTDVGHLSALELNESDQRQWSRWFLEQSAADASGLAGLGGVWTFIVEQFPEAAALPQPQALLDQENLKRRAFLRLLNKERAFVRTIQFAPGFADFADALHKAENVPEKLNGVAQSETEQTIRAFLVNAVAEALGVPPERVSTTQPVIYFGLDSVAAIKIAGDLETLVGRKLPPTVLFDHPTLEQLAAVLANPEHAPKPAQVDRTEDSTLDLSIFDSLPQEAQQNVLVTGVTGFLCGFLLAELLRSTRDRATCIVRATDPAAGMARIRANLTQYGLWEEAFASRIDVVLGDLERPRFGLSNEAFLASAQRIDIIFHGGAIVDFIQPYERLRPANVQGTHEIIRLAVLGGRVPLNFISTIAVFDTRDQNGNRRLTEEEIPNEKAGFRNGYSESKWVAERLVNQAGTKGLPIRIFRPGVVSGDTQRGAWQPDLAAALLKTYARRGVAILPAHSGVFDAAPVDYVARALLHIAQTPQSLGGVYHLTNPRPTPWTEVYQAMEKIGYGVRALPYAEWLHKLSADENAKDIRPFLPFFRERGETWQIRQPFADCARTVAALDGSGIACPRVDERLLSLYLDYLLDKPRSKAARGQTQPNGYGS